MDLNKMTLEQVLDYLADRDLFLLSLLVDCDGIDEVRRILKDNGRI